MKAFVTTILALFLATNLSGQSKTKLKTKIDDVRVFFQNAQISRSASLDIPKGTTTLEISNLSPFIDENSIQVSIDGNVTIVSVNHQLAFTAQKSINSLQKQLEQVNDSIAYQRMLLGVNKETEKFFIENKSIGGTDSGYKLTDLTEISAFYSKKLLSIKSENLTINDILEDLSIKKTALENQLNEVYGDRFTSTGTIIVKVETSVFYKGKISLSYVVDNAGWFPNYDIRVNKLSEPIEVSLKALLYQNTGEDWNNVKLTFSNANPKSNSTIPHLDTYYLSFNQVVSKNRYSERNPDISRVTGRVTDENGEGLPGTSILVKGTSVGIVSDFNGYYSLELPRNANILHFSFVGYNSREVSIGSKSIIDVSMQPSVEQLEEVVSVGYGLQGRIPGVSTTRSKYKKEAKQNLPQITKIENQTSIEYSLQKPYSLPSGNEKATLVVKRDFIPSNFEYRTVPKLDQNTFLIANMIDWSQYNLIEAPTNLYFENTYVGKTVLDAGIISDTLSISLGQDKNVLVKREKLTDFEKRQNIGPNKLETKAWKIVVLNQKKEDISIRVTDQVPISTNSEIDVETEETTNGNLDEDSGMVTWNLELAPNEQKELIVKYKVKYPKHKRLIIN